MHKILIMIMLINVFMFIMTIHPLVLGLMLITQTLMLCFLTYLICQSSWFGYILFLIMIGGMLILFIYMTSIAANEFSSMNFIMTKYWLIYSIILTLIITYIIYINSSIQSIEMSNFTSMMKTLNNDSLQFNMKLYNLPTYNLMILMIIYLLITLLVTVSISTISQIPLRSKF
uniref:NADH-ubiquinone oxidoreductase chain 6 n=1 Tax=Nallachius americanus TaxID=560880 RepID=A0A1S5QY41_9NEOP|nr:NADH dehydrogenase subunit 6 [Nallachius americanus]